MKKTQKSEFLHDLPSDLEKAIASKQAASKAWGEIIPLAQNEWICWVTSAVKPQTRNLRIERTKAELVEGKKRPRLLAGLPASPVECQKVVFKKTNSPIPKVS